MADRQAKVAVITGGTAGFGAATTRRFVREGWKVVITGRREQRLEELQQELGGPDVVHTVTLDMRDRAAVERSLGSLPAGFRDVDLLVNNAGLALGIEPAWACDMDDWETMVDTNIKGVLYATRTLLPGMVERNRGHVINLGSVAGSHPYPGGNVYMGTKAFVKQFSMGLRADLFGKPIRVTNVEPGLSESEFSVVRFRGDKDKADSLYEGKNPLTPDDIAECIHWAASLPPHVNINRIEVMPVSQSFAGLHAKPTE
ncbi:MAG: SDR family oxidoreductase [Ectothiorhodospiraceae bacterium]|nr:SDR family oxidoreductase [Ectothiorhodospiraceae bacterium]